MSDKSEEPSGDQNPDEIRAEAKSLLNEIKRIKGQAEEQFKAAETARKNADSEGLFAINAKKVCEEHSTSISQLKGTVEVEVNSIATNKQKSDDLLAALTVGKATIDADINTISEQRRKVDQAAENLVNAANTGATRLQETESSKAAAAALLKETQEMRDATIEARNKATIAQTQVQQFFTQASELATKITDAHTTSTDLSAKVNEILRAATTDQETLKEILDKLTKSHETASAFETRVTKSSADFDMLKEKVLSLLPGATSASLASAYATQKERFRNPKKWWIVVFLVCMSFLVVVAAPSFIAALSDKLPSKTWSDIFMSFAMRLPILIPLVWLAIYAGRNYMLSIRLEEDYAYKEAISTSFEGYKREMEKIAGDQPAGPNNPITTLCVNVLKAIAERPGRIYEGKHKDITLQNEALEIFEQAKDLAQKKVADR